MLTIGILDQSRKDNGFVSSFCPADIPAERGFQLPVCRSDAASAGFAENTPAAFHALIEDCAGIRHGVVAYMKFMPNQFSNERHLLLWGNLQGST